MMRTLVLAGVLAGCNPIFGIEETATFDDAAVLVDTDGDEVGDDVDNCPTLANDQSDEDEDGIGDTCDNCPLVTNPLQDADGDDDPVGDACDPRPVRGGDCLVMFDSFANAPAFASHWRTLSASGAGPVTVAPQPGHVTLDTTDVLPVTIVALDGSGAPLLGRYDVQLIARAELTTNGAFGVTSDASDYRTGYACAVVNLQERLAVLVGSYAASTSTSNPSRLSTEPTRALATVRLLAPVGSETFVGCRADLGTAAGVAAVVLSPTTPRPPPGGSPGIRVALDAVDALAVAIYRHDPAQACPAPIYR